MNSKYDAVVVGGGFYGVCIALYLKQRGLKKVILIEQSNALLSRASYHNQARVHNGYHYPRSFTTAYRSRINLPRFVRDWPFAVNKSFTKLYAIARRNSKVTAKQFDRFCKEIDAKIEKADDCYQRLFNKQLIEEVFLVEEYAFDSSKLAEWASVELASNGIEIRLLSRVDDLSKVGVLDESRIKIEVSSGSGNSTVFANYVFNCTYSGLNQISGDFPKTQTQLKHEVTEMALIETPSCLKDLGITVMDGPFFSVMPFPARGLHSLSHVRYTPHFSWFDSPASNPYKELLSYHQESRANRMLRDVARYLPDIVHAEYRDSLFEVKTILLKNEGDDGRPILFEKHLELPGCFSVLGGKIDNIYDVLERLEGECFESI